MAVNAVSESGAVVVNVELCSVFVTTTRLQVVPFIIREREKEVGGRVYAAATPTPRHARVAPYHLSRVQFDHGHGRALDITIDMEPFRRALVL